MFAAQPRVGRRALDAEPDAGGGDLDPLHGRRCDLVRDDRVAARDRMSEDHFADACGSAARCGPCRVTL